MADGKEHNVNPELHTDGDCNAGLSEKKLMTHVTLPDKEVAGNDESGSSGSETEKTSELKAVQEYTSRIKNFLGWESVERNEDSLEKQSFSDRGKNVSKNERPAAAGEAESLLGTEVCLELSDNNNSVEDLNESTDIEIVYRKSDTDISLPISERDVYDAEEPIIHEADSCVVLEYVSTSEDTGIELPDSKATGSREVKSLSKVCEEPRREFCEESNPQGEKSVDGIADLQKEDKDLDIISKNVPVTDQSLKSVIHEENVTSSENRSKPSLEGIRRLSLDLVKGAIDSARTSVYELHLNKSEIENNICDLETPNAEGFSILSLGNNDQENSENDTTESNEILKLNCTKNGLILGKNLSKPYVESIRRLSLDIVKNILDSARNSAYESDLKMTENNVFEVQELVSVSAVPNLTAMSAEGRTDDVSSHFIEKSTTDKDAVCGIWCFKPKWIQRWATPKVYLFVFSLIGVVHGAYYNYFVAMISTLEKRYAFRSKVSGTLLLADEITPLVLGIIVGYIGGRTHRPRMVAFGMFLSATCCFVTALPYFIYGSKKHFTRQDVKNQTSVEFCVEVLEKDSNSCTADSQPPTLPVVGLFLLASFLKGFATLSYYVIGIPYMDDNSEKRDSPLYLAIALALRLLGPLVGFLMSSGFLKFYENPFEDPGYGPDDPRWIGAWWLGFVVQGTLLVIFTIPIALFPRRLPGHKKQDQQSVTDGKEIWKNLFTGLWDALKRLWQNPIFVFLAINTTMKIFGHFGHAIMLPKYMENQFRLSASDASLFSGATSIFCIMVSTILGGFLIWKFRPTAKTLLGGMIASEVILCLGYLLLMIPRCQPADMLNFGSNKDGLILNSMCNQNCDCSTTSFSPFCGPDGKSTYFSPCFAGCTLELESRTTGKERKEFGNCSCVVDENGDPGANITEGFCVDESCWTQTLTYICVLLVLVTISNTLTVAHTIILLRSVHPKDKSVALGTFETFICLFGFIPFPVTFGALVDSACVIWEESCGETGNCWFYDMEKYNYLLHGASSFFCSVSVCCLTTLYCLSSRLKDLYKDEEVDKDRCNVKLDTVDGSITKL